MPIERGDSEHAGELARRSAQVRRRLTLEDVETELPRLDSLDAAKQRLERLSDWGAAGLLPGTVLNGAVRAVEVWVKVHAEQLDMERVEVLEKRIAELEAELKQRRA
jgi:hypothetical protein